MKSEAHKTKSFLKANKKPNKKIKKKKARLPKAKIVSIHLIKSFSDTKPKIKSNHKRIKSKRTLGTDSNNEEKPVLVSENINSNDTEVANKNKVTQEKSKEQKRTIGCLFKRRFVSFAKSKKKKKGRTINYKNTINWLKKAGIMDNQRIGIPDVEAHFINSVKKSDELGILDFIQFLKGLTIDRGLGMKKAVQSLIDCEPPKKIKVKKKVNLFKRDVMSTKSTDKSQKGQNKKNLYISKYAPYTTSNFLSKPIIKPPLLKKRVINNRNDIKRVSIFKVQMEPSVRRNGLKQNDFRPRITNTKMNSNLKTVRNLIYMAQVREVENPDAKKNVISQRNQDTLSNLGNVLEVKKREQLKLKNPKLRENFRNIPDPRGKPFKNTKEQVKKSDLKDSKTFLATSSKPIAQVFTPRKETVKKVNMKSSKSFTETGKKLKVAKHYKPHTDVVKKSHLKKSNKNSATGAKSMVKNLKSHNTNINKKYLGNPKAYSVITSTKPKVKVKKNKLVNSKTLPETAAKKKVKIFKPRKELVKKKHLRNSKTFSDKNTTSKIKIFKTQNAQINKNKKSTVKNLHTRKPQVKKNEFGHSKAFSRAGTNPAVKEVREKTLGVSKMFCKTGSKPNVKKFKVHKLEESKNSFANSAKPKVKVFKNNKEQVKKNVLKDSKSNFTMGAKPNSNVFKTQIKKSHFKSPNKTNRETCAKPKIKAFKTRKVEVKKKDFEDSTIFPAKRAKPKVKLYRTRKSRVKKKDLEDPITLLQEK